MNTLASIVGFLIIGVVAIAAIALIILFVIWRAQELMNRLREEGGEDVRLRIANALRQDGYWFSEDERTMKLLHAFADDLGRGVTSDVSSIRERWRLR